MSKRIIPAFNRRWMGSIILGTAALALTTLAFFPVPAVTLCDQLYAKYEGSTWWWGAFGNCKKYGGTVNRNAIFECAWQQVPAPENITCLKNRLRTSPSTKKGTDAVVIFNVPLNCNQLYAKYEGSNWWWGAFGNCKKHGGTVDQNAIFECAWQQVPAPDNTVCLKGRLRWSASTKKGIDVVVAFNGRSATNRPTIPANSCPGGQNVSGYQYVSIPACASRTRADHPSAMLICDSSGYYCCENAQGAKTPRCGTNRWGFEPDCMAGCAHVSGNCQIELIRQNGIIYGCYKQIVK